MGNRGIGGFPTYKPQASTKEECIKAMRDKIDQLNREIKFHETGLLKIESLEKKKFYELTSDTGISLVQCIGFGRDHVRFRRFACSNANQITGTLVEFSCHWTNSWTVKPVDPKDAVLYTGFALKTSHFEKLLKGTYRCLPISNDSPESTPMSNVSSAE